MPKRLMLLIALYCCCCIAALLRAVMAQSFDIFTLSVFPVLIGMLMRTPWSSLMLKIFIGMQTLGFSALAITAIIAYRITPEDVKVVISGHNIPILPLTASMIFILLIQYWAAFSKVTSQYLTRQTQ
ncbi:hypothetical protein [Shewanella morhuae]|uniref:hypothetical protein n=1 Tax=Shewanella morhuae TaxID=365591 RepID=UPI0009706EA2|nr:hypothetical protein [Shewanella morhuae]